MVQNTQQNSFYLPGFAYSSNEKDTLKNRRKRLSKLGPRQTYIESTSVNPKYGRTEFSANILKEIEGAIPISRWGASPCVFRTKTFLKALNKFRNLDEEINLLDRFTREFYAMSAHDVLFPTLFALIGEEEVYNPDIIECHTDPFWRQKSNPLVHSFTEYFVLCLFSFEHFYS